jgi:hypothetical protein
MTGYTVHTGSTIKFSTGWDLIFQGKKTEKKSSVAQSVKPEKTPKKVAKESTKKNAVKPVKAKTSHAAKKKSATTSVKRRK